MNCKKIIPIIAGSLLLIIFMQPTMAQKNDKAIIAYFSGNPDKLDSFDAKSMTHIIYCFGHLDSNRFKISRLRDTLTIKKMVAMKAMNPGLKVLLSLGGWGGCRTCSDVFNTRKGRREFVQSVKETNEYFATDGIDLDWEYPAVLGYPGHTFRPEDKDNFTALIKQLRKKLGKKKVITFAAGGFSKYLDSAVNWKKVAKNVDYINLMTYDLVSGYSTKTGHHTALYSSPDQKELTDNCVQDLVKKGVDPGKLIIGAAFYARVWENVPAENNGLFKPGSFKMVVDYKNFTTALSTDSGYVYLWDDAIKAPYAFNASKNLFATFDDKRSIALKTQYVLDHNLGGIMFWELGSDTYTDGLLHTINKTLNKPQ